MTSTLASAFILICAGWLFLGDPVTCQAQQTEADTKLMETIKAAAEKGDPGKQYALGGIYFSGEHGVAQNYAKAVYWFRKAAEQGSAEAQSQLGFCYNNGWGVAQ